MIERLIESWLTEVEERHFQIAFCQILQSRGITVLHRSPHGPDEQGKDIIALLPGNEPACYQIKTGTIDLSRFRREVWPELEVLLDIPIHHPSVPDASPHQSFLVATGELKDPARRELDDRNRARTQLGKRTVSLVPRGELLTWFGKMSSDFLPQEVADLTRLFTLYTMNGREPLPKQEFARFLSGVKGSLGVNKSRCASAGAALQVFTSYGLRAFLRADNHWSICDGWMLSLCALSELAERHGALGDMAPVIDLAAAEIGLAADSLTAEWFVREGFVQGASLLDGKFIPHRSAIMLGYLTGADIVRRLGTRGMPAHYDVSGAVDRALEHARLFSEWAGPCFLNAIWWLRLEGRGEEANRVLVALVDGVLQANKRGEPGLINAYYEVEDVIRSQLGLKSSVGDETFWRRSYLLRTLVLLATRAGLREELQERWRAISRIEFCEFVPDHPEDAFAYRSERGQQHSALPNRTESWARLQAEAESVGQSDVVPGSLVHHPEIIPLFLLTMPHRLRPSLVLYLDRLVGERLQ